MAADPYSKPGQVTPEDQAKWAAYRQSLQQWQTITSHGGNPGPKPTAPTPQDTPSMYPSTTQYTEPNGANGAGDDSALSGYNLDPTASSTAAPQDSAFTGRHPANAPTGVFYEPPATPGAGGAAPSAAGPNLSTGERATYAPDLTQSNADRGQQAAYLDSLRAAASGQAPSVAEAQMHQALSTAARNSLGIAAQARGGDAVAARRAAILGNASQGAQAAQGAAALRAQEIAAVRGQLGGALSDVRATDTGTALHTADQTSANQQGNLNRESGERIQGGALGNQRYATDVGAGSQKYAVDVNAATGRYAADRAQENAVLGGVLGGVSTAGAAYVTKSDERAKTDVQSDASETEKFIAALRPFAYRYRNPSDGTGERHGIMAQDLERSRIGRSVVHDTPGGKMVDTGALTLALAGAVAQLAKDKRLGGGK